MNKKRFNEFKKDVEQGFASIVQAYPNTSDFVHNIGRNVESKYSELLPSSNQQEPNQRREKVAQDLRLNFDNKRFVDYQNIEQSLKRNNPEECIESINLLSKAIGDSRRKIIYYSALQGELLKAVKEATSSYTFSTLLALKPMSKSYAYFLMKLYEIVQEYQQLRHCQLPIRFFMLNLSVIKEVCDMDPDRWR